MLIIENLNVSFETQKIFNNFNLHINKGEKVALIGKSGSGKTTLINAINGFIPSYTGEIYVSGIKLSPESINRIRLLTSFLPQNTFIEAENVKELLLAPFNFKINKGNIPSLKKIKTILSIFNLEEDILSKKINEISGGQKQRILTASSLLLNKPIFFADEPTSALDLETKMKITDYIMSDKNLTVIASTHDEYWINKSDRTIEII